MKHLRISGIIISIMFLISGCGEECTQKPLAGSSLIMIFCEAQDSPKQFLDFFDTNIRNVLREFIEECTYESKSILLPKIQVLSLTENTIGEYPLGMLELDEKDGRDCCFEDKYISKMVGDIKEQISNNYKQNTEGIRVLPSLKRITEEANKLERPSKICIFYFSDMMELIADNPICGTYSFGKKGTSPLMLDYREVERASNHLQSDCIQSDYVKPLKQALSMHEVTVRAQGLKSVVPDPNGRGYDLVKSFWKNCFSSAGVKSEKMF